MLLFSNREPKSFPKCIATLNKFLIYHHNEKIRTDISMSSSILSFSNVVKKKCTVNVDKGLDHMFGYLTKTFKVQKIVNLLFSVVIFFEPG